MAKDVYAHIDDRELLARFHADHNNDWLGILLGRYTLLLFGVCMKYLKEEEEAKDAVQQIFLKVITELHKYKVEYFKSWLYMIAKNECLMKLRSSGHRQTADLTDDLYYDEATATNELLQKDQTLGLVEDGIAELNHEQKVCVTLFYLKKKSYQEIATFTGYNLLQVKSYIQNGKRNLKTIVEKKIKQVNG